MVSAVSSRRLALRAQRLVGLPGTMHISKIFAIKNKLNRLVFFQIVESLHTGGVKRPTTMLELKKQCEKCS